MTNGPPWVSNVLVQNPPGAWLTPNTAWFHVELDETRRWTLSARVHRSLDDASAEISIEWYKPSTNWLFLKGAASFLTMNEAYPEHPLQQTGFKFDNEEIYIMAQKKVKYGVGSWTAMRAINANIVATGNGAGGECNMTFYGSGPDSAGNRTTVSVSIDVE